MWRFAADDPLAAVVAACVSKGRLHCLAVEHTTRGACLASHRFAVQHEGDVVDRAEQQASDEAAEPPVHCLPRAEMDRQHPPTPGTAGQVTDRVQHLSQVDRGLAPAA